MAVDTILLCALEDLSVNDGTKNHYSMSHGLMVSFQNEALTHSSSLPSFGRRDLTYEDGTIVQLSCGFVATMALIVT